MDLAEENSVKKRSSTRRHEVLEQLGECYISVGNFLQAKRYYEKAAILAPDVPGPCVGLGIVALQNGYLENAETEFKLALSLDNNCAKAYCGLAMVADQRNDYEQAFEFYLRSLELDVDNLTALLGLFQTSCRLESYAQVIQHLEAYLDMHPTDIEVMLALAASYMKEDRLDEAKKLLSDVLILEPAYEKVIDLLKEVDHRMAQRNISSNTV